MKKPLKIILIVSGVLLALLLATFGLYGFLMFRETSKMTPAETGEAVPGVFAVKESFVNLWLVKTPDGYIAFDAGNSEKGTAKELAALGIDPLEVRAVFLTHTDRDHVGALMLFRNADVYIGAEEQQMIDGTTARAMGMKNKVKSPTGFGPVPDGGILTQYGPRILAVHTPGHTPGHTCWLVDGKYLFTGDTLGLVDGKAGQFNNFFNMDTERETESLKILARAVKPTHIFSGHYGWTAVNEETFSAYR